MRCFWLERILERNERISPSRRAQTEEDTSCLLHPRLHNVARVTGHGEVWTLSCCVRTPCWLAQCRASQFSGSMRKVLRGTRTISFCQLYSYTHVHDTWRVYRLWHRWQHSCQPSSVASTWPKLMMFNILGHMTHVRVTWVLSCTIWCYHYTHLHTSCLTEIMFCALRWGHCPRVGFFLCPGLLRKGSLLQTGAQQLPVLRPMATLPVSLCTLIAVAVIVIDSMLGALWGGQSPAFSSRFSPSTTESWDWTLSLVWLAMVAPAELSLCHCHSYLHLPFYVTDRKSFPLLFRDLCGQSSF